MSPGVRVIFSFIGERADSTTLTTLRFSYFDVNNLLLVLASKLPPPPLLPPLFLSRKTQIQDPLIRGDIGKVAVLILDANGALLERFVADLKVREKK